jgi:hypothetical protein
MCFIENNRDYWFSSSKVGPHTINWRSHTTNSRNKSSPRRQLKNRGCHRKCPDKSRIFTKSWNGQQFDHMTWKQNQMLGLVTKAKFKQIHSDELLHRLLLHSYCSIFNSGSTKYILWRRNPDKKVLYKVARNYIDHVY